MKARWVLVACLLASALALAAPTITLTPSAAAPGSIVTISITGQGAETCGIEIRDPANSVVFLDQITLSAGTGSVQWRIPLDARSGTYTIFVTCETTPGRATATLTVSPLVGGEVKRDFTPYITTLAVAALAAASFVLAKRELKG
jgi:hypothetical protein